MFQVEKLVGVHYFDKINFLKRFQKYFVTRIFSSFSWLVYIIAIFSIQTWLMRNVENLVCFTVIFRKSVRERNIFLKSH